MSQLNVNTAAPESKETCEKNKAKALLDVSPLFESELLVRDAHGLYQVASIDQILMAARQVIGKKYIKGMAYTKPADICEYLKFKLAGMGREVFAVVYLDNRHALIDYRELFQGTVDSVEVHPREVLKAALQVNASAVILCHNHPSGFPEPSKADVAITRRLVDALGLVDMRVLDHIIVAGNDTVSMAERGMI